MRITQVDFASLLTYASRGDQPEHRLSRTMMRYLKNDSYLQSGNLMSSFIVGFMKRRLDTYPFADYFSESTVLIPIPKSSLSKNDGLWVPHRITTELADHGMGVNEKCLIRHTALPRSSKVVASLRPKAFQHYESMRVESLLDPEEIVLV